MPKPPRTTDQPVPLLARPGNSGDGVYAAIHSAIIDQALRPATRLREGAIAGQFGVSRTVVRGALARLAAEGLVTQMPNRGSIVAKPSFEEARDIFEIRGALEALVIARLSAQRSTEQLAALDAHVRAEESVKGRDGPESVRLAGAFHLLLAELTESPPLVRYVREVVSRCSLILTLYGRPHSSDCAVSEHRQLIAAIRRRDAAGACKLMAHHLGAVAERAVIPPPRDAGADVAEVLANYAPGERPR
jgi:DNA-binding GntR family transcriptional regulator